VRVRGTTPPCRRPLLMPLLAPHLAPSSF
jgi:hypothetical protein